MQKASEPLSEEDQGGNGQDEVRHWPGTFQACLPSSGSGPWLLHGRGAWRRTEQACLGG